MLQQNNIVRVLSQALTNGVDTAIKGEIHACASNHANSLERGELAATVLSESWSTLREELCRQPLDGDIHEILYVLEGGKVGMAPVDSGFLALVGDCEAPLGNIRLKMRLLHKHIQDPLAANHISL
ncbi:hypothetical protein IWQ62_001413 [Dispira parvispora]|uniref:Roadblock/LAMTOR2 domain-containing protein n=1 Tax=Dispira parvispora TaxID=1520584 RepID=A0A9W8E933_9FUNG|nr:hypothetical protein IWQ62_001413 [Dispira parvispora]